MMTSAVVTKRHWFLGAAVAFLVTACAPMDAVPRHLFGNSQGHGAPALEAQDGGATIDVAHPAAPAVDNTTDGTAVDDLRPLSASSTMSLPLPKPSIIPPTPPVPLPRSGAEGVAHVAKSPAVVTNPQAIVAASNCDDALPAPGILLAVIQFANGSDRLDVRDRSILRAVAALQLRLGGSLTVVGYASSHTTAPDVVGRRLVNFNISARRAAHVAATLRVLGASVKHVRALSDNRPLYQESTSLGEAGNRRAEIYYLY